MQQRKDNREKEGWLGLFLTANRKRPGSMTFIFLGPKRFLLILQGLNQPRMSWSDSINDGSDTMSIHSHTKMEKRKNGSHSLPSKMKLQEDLYNSLQEGYKKTKVPLSNK